MSPPVSGPVFEHQACVVHFPRCSRRTTTPALSRIACAPAGRARWAGPPAPIGKRGPRVDVGVRRLCFDVWFRRKTLPVIRLSKGTPLQCVSEKGEPSFNYGRKLLPAIGMVRQPPAEKTMFRVTRVEVGASTRSMPPAAVRKKWVPGKPELYGWD